MTYLVSGLVIGGMYGLIALGLVLTFRTTGVLNLAHGAMGMFSSFLYIHLRTNEGWPADQAVVAALLVAAVLGLAVERLTIRPLEGASVLSKVIVSLGVLGVLQSAGGSLFGLETKYVPSFLPTSTFRLSGINVGWDQVGLLAIAAATSGALFAWLRFTRFGLWVRATADSQRMARLSGIPVNTVSSVTWALGSVLAGVAGILLAPLIFPNTTSMTLLLVKALAAALLGGLTSLPLALGGGIVIGLIESVLAPVLESPGIRESLAFFVILALLLYRGSSWLPRVRDLVRRRRITAPGETS